MKRFYRKAEATDVADGHGVSLDGRPMRTPAKQLLVMPRRALADAVAAEWQAQEEVIRRETMPLTRLACTALDRVAAQRELVVADTAKYAETDLLCYRAAEPEELVRRQHETWQPLLDWARARYDAELEVTTGPMPIAQEDATLTRLGSAVASLDEFTLTALNVATTASGSLVIALALVEQEIDAETACAASQVDESWQVEQWGKDPELELRREELRSDLIGAARLMALLRA